MKQNFKGWSSVYRFTFRQETKGIAFKLVTVLFSLLIIGAIVTANMFDAKSDNKSGNSKTTESLSIESVYVLDNSGLQATDYQTLNPELGKEPYKNIKYVNSTNQKRNEVVKEAGKASKSSLAVIITKTEKGFEMEGVIPSESTVSKGDANSLMNLMSTAFTTSKLLQSGLPADALTKAMEPSVTSYADVGENRSEIVMIIKIVTPMLFSFILYFMLLMYGQTISKSVSTEKTSKLVETLLTSVHPYALITGKILAVTTMALLQFVSWIVSGFIGLYAGNAVAHIFYPNYHNSVVTVINFLKDNIGETALSAPSVILGIIFFCVGFLFYAVMAGVAGCMVSKPEDVASTQALFQFPIIISWLAVYFAPISGYEGFLNIARYIPFTAPFSVPAELISGSTGLLEGLIAFAVLCIFTLIFIMFSGKIYKGLILYSGEKVNLKMIGNILRAKN